MSRPRPVFREGDWVFEEFSLKQVRRVEDGMVCEVSDGSFCRSSRDLDCFPLTMRNKIIADTVKYYSNKIQDIGSNSLNMPDIYRHLEGVFIDACSLPAVKDGKEDVLLKKKFDELRKFVEDVADSVETAKQKEVSGVRVFRQ